MSVVPVNHFLMYPLAASPWLVATAAVLAGALAVPAAGRVVLASTGPVVAGVAGSTEDCSTTGAVASLCAGSTPILTEPPDYVPVQ